MKKLLFTLGIVISSSTLLMAQDDCMAFFPTDEGAVLINKSYDANNNLLSTMTYRVDKSYGVDNNKEIIIGFVMTDADGNAIDTGNLDARCDDGTFFLNMVNRSLSPDIMKYLGQDTELVGDFLDYPDTFDDNFPFDGNFRMDGGEFTVRSKTNKNEFMRVRVYDRKYETRENITTPVKTFQASKLSFNFEVTQDKKTTTYKGIEWYAVGAGIVRSETYDSKGNLLNYTVLTALQDK